MKCHLFCGSLFLATLCSSANATEFVYTPKNPSFGGNPINGSIFLNEAQITNKYDQAPTTQPSSLQQFNQNLQNMVLSRIASSISGGLFDPSGKLIPGTISTTDFTITITTVSAGPPAILNITTTDRNTGQSTSFQVSQ
jgi:curli production assembly/transport component CsgF